MDAQKFYGGRVGGGILRNRIENVMRNLEEKREKRAKLRNNPREPYIDDTRDGHELREAYRRFDDRSLSALLQPLMVWKNFCRQSDALDFAQTSDDLHVFAFENGRGGGKRNFLVTSYDHFFHVYLRVTPDFRCHYEVIPEHYPVKLFYDLEYDREYNPGINDEALVDCVIRETCSFLRCTFSERAFCENDVDVLKLEASTTKKFSQHLIFPDICFANCQQLGGFVLQMIHILQEKALTNPADECRQLFVQKGDGNTVSCIDKGVYTKNRNFRLYLSRKQGKENPLVLTLDSQSQDRQPRETFLLSLICNVTQAAELHLAFEADPACRALNGSFDSSDRAGERAKTPTKTGQGPSPFPQLDHFFTDVVCQHGLKSYIQTWKHFPGSDTVIFGVGGEYRYCEHIGRHHKSNGVFFVACLTRGVFYQKCLDPDCRSYKSREYLLPVVKEADHVPDSDLPISEDGKGAGTGFTYCAWASDEEFDNFITSIPM